MRSRVVAQQPFRLTGSGWQRAKLPMTAVSGEQKHGCVPKQKLMSFYNVALSECEPKLFQVKPQHGAAVNMLSRNI